MITMPYRYKPQAASGSIPRVIEADSVTTLASAIVEAERGGAFATPVFDGRGTLFVPPGESRSAATRFIERVVGCARRDFEARSGSVGQDCFTVTLFEDDGKAKVSYWAVPTALFGHRTGLPGPPHSIDADGIGPAAAEIVARLNDRFLFE
jgi:hypothetical protein